jgi:hypothetical protein
MVEATTLLREARLDDIQRASPGGTAAARRIVHDLQEALARFVELSGAIGRADGASESEHNGHGRSKR